jgi:hypothetical protein
MQYFLATIILGLGLGTSGLRADTASPSYLTHVASADEMGVYAAYLQQTYTKAKHDGPLARSVLVIENESRDLWFQNRRAWEAYLVENIQGPGRASDACIRAYLGRTPATLSFFSFPPLEGSELRLVRSDELAGIVGGGWDKFYAAFPGAGGILSFGGIGWSPNHQEALFTVYLRCGRHCGYHDIVYMQYLDEAWHLTLKQDLP